MEAEIKVPNIGVHITRGKEKFDFIPKPAAQNGLFMQVHHSLRSADRRTTQQTHFMQASFDANCEKLVAVDHLGNAFAVDLLRSKFWFVCKTGPCTALMCHNKRPDLLLAGMSDGHLKFIGVESCKLLANRMGHKVAVSRIALHSTGHFAITMSSQSAVIWDVQRFTKEHVLNPPDGMTISEVFYFSSSDKIFSCFSDNSMVIWKSQDFTCERNVLPNNQHATYTVFTCIKNGKILVAGSHHLMLHFYSLETYEFIKMIEMSYSSSIKQIACVTQLFPEISSEILAVLYSDGHMQFLDPDEEKIQAEITDTKNKTIKIVSSASAKYISCVKAEGEIKIYYLLTLLTGNLKETNIEEQLKEVKLSRKKSTSPSQSLPKLPEVKESKRPVFKVPKNITLKRLKPILMEFWEYPEKYRNLIWRALLKTPGNSDAYLAFATRGIHPNFQNLEEKHPIEDQKLSRGLQKLCSCLSYWSPIFGELIYLPSFVFPFVKVYQNNPVLCFEVAVTILTNWCQQWFQYHPFPPLGILSIIENVMGHHDPKLLEKFNDKGITAQIYAWSLLQVAFTEVFTRTEWLQFWDHVLSNHPSFLLMATVAYNIYFHSVLMKCSHLNDFEVFYHNQNAINMKQFLQKIYNLMESTPEDIHPQQYIQPLQSLPQGGYPVFNEYPHFVVDYQIKELERIRKEEQEILEENELIMAAKLEQQKRITKERDLEDQESRIKLAEEERKRELREQEEKLQEHRFKVDNMRRELRTRQLQLLESTRKKLLRERAAKRDLQLGRLEDDIHRKKSEYQLEVGKAVEELHDHYMDLLIQKQALEQSLGLREGSSAAFAMDSSYEDKIRRARKYIERKSSAHHTAKINLANHLAEMEDALHAIDAQLAAAQVHKDLHNRTAMENMGVWHLGTRMESLEQELGAMSRQVSKMKIQEGERKLGLLGEGRGADEKFFREKSQELQNHLCQCKDKLKNLETDNNCQRNEPSDDNKFETHFMTFDTSLASGSFEPNGQNAIQAAMKVREKIAKQTNCLANLRARHHT